MTLYQRDRTWHPPALAPDYKTSVARSPRQAMLSLEATASELTGPRFGHDDIAPGDNDLITNYARGGDPVGERIIVHGRVLDENAPPRPAHAGRDLAGQCGRALPPQEGQLSGRDRSELRRLRADADGRGGPLCLSHDQARRLSLAQLGEQLAARAYPCLGLRAQLRAAPDHPDVFRGRPADRRIAPS